MPPPSLLVLILLMGRGKKAVEQRRMHWANSKNERRKKANKLGATILT
jgi:hypothetical protein